MVKLGRPVSSDSPGMGGMGMGMGMPNMAMFGAMGQQPPAMAAVAPLMQGVPQGGQANNRLYVGSIFFELNEQDITNVFAAFGTIKSCQLIRDPATGRHKGYGFIEYETAASADAALQQMQDFELAGRKLKVGRATAGNAMPAAMNPMMAAVANANTLLANPAMLTGLGANPLLANPLLANPLLAAQMRMLQGQAPMGMPGTGGGGVVHSLAKEENLTVSGNQRIALMQQLSRDTHPSKCLVLRDMVGVDEVDDELQGEVTAECSKFGQVAKVVIYTEKGEGTADGNVKIFVLFSNMEEAGRALQHLNNRWFGGRVIKAEYYPEDKMLSEDLSG
eukprot:c20621_g3_i1.p2 GENE.c20621_g3_i1~~c20621_g3_i1.p2  ORF type:complete len:334 (+),score=88.01 c20621_g3_i1:1647-2648(+)